MDGLFLFPLVYRIFAQMGELLVFPFFLDIYIDGLTVSLFPLVYHIFKQAEGLCLYFPWFTELFT